MKRLLESLPTNEWRTRLGTLSRMHIDVFERENNIVRNAALLDALNLRQASAQILGPPKPTPPPRPRPRPRAPNAAPQGAVRKSSRLAKEGGRAEKDTARGGGEDDEEGGEGKGEEEEDEEGREGEGEEEENANGETRMQLDEERGRDDREREEDGGQGKSTPDDTTLQDKSE
jgi:hypothetical protein